MNNDKGLLSGSITILIGAVIAIMALVRGPWQAWLLIGVFTLWGLWVVLILLLPYMVQAKCRRQRQQREHHLHAEGIGHNVEQKPFHMPELDEPMPDELLLRYANHRILGYLHSLYPDSYFEWCEKSPVDLIRSSGTGRIRLYGVQDFDHADITFGKDATIRCDMLKIVPLTKLDAACEDSADIPPNKQPIDPSIWYENQCRTVLETLIADLNSRGHNKLTLKENGDVCVHQGDDLVPQEHLSSFPAKVYWPRLLEVLDHNGLAAETTAQGIQVSW